MAQLVRTNVVAWSLQAKRKFSADMCANSQTANFGNPIVGFLPLMFVFVGWYANIKLFGLIPEAGTIIIIGTVLAWIDPTTRGKVCCCGLQTRGRILCQWP